MTSGWFVEDIELPLPPATEVKEVTREFKSDALENFFPELTQSKTSTFNYILTGIIYPDAKVIALEQLARSADTETVVVWSSTGDSIYPQQRYAIRKLSLNRNKPLFVRYRPVDSLVDVSISAYQYTLSLTELPDEGEFQEGIDGFQDADEGALGEQQLNELIDDLGVNIDILEYGPIAGYQLLTKYRLRI